MKTTQGNVLLSLRNVQGFLQDNATRLASVLDNVMTKRLNDAIVTLSGHATDQVQTLIDAKSTTQTQEALRTELIQFHMAPINRIAKLELANIPELKSFLMPKGKPTIEKLKTFADGMSAAAAKYSATFFAGGLPTDFIAQLDDVATAMVEAQSSRARKAATRKGATNSLQVMLATGRKIVRVIDPLVRKVIKNDSGLLTIWNTVKRVPRTAATATPAAPATPAASTPAAAQQSHTPTT
jgi:hypothetical protein